MKPWLRNTLIAVFVPSAIAGAYFGYLAYKKYKDNKKAVGCNASFLFIGDSTMAYSNSFGKKLLKHCPDAKIEIRAKSGQKTDWMVPQLEEALASGKKYDVITILGGSNDIFARLKTDKTKLNLQNMYNMAQQHGAQVVAVTPPNKKFYPRTRDQHRELIRNLWSWIKGNPSVDHFIDLENLVAKENLFASDKQHINDKGHEIVKDEFIKQVVVA